MEYNSVIDCWFNLSRHYWFINNDAFDIFLTDIYKKLLLEQLTCNDNITWSGTKDDNKIILSKILLCDQFSRRIFKNDSEMIKKFDKISLKLLIDTEILKNIDIFTVDAQYFIISPFINKYGKNFLNVLSDKRNHPIFNKKNVKDIYNIEYYPNYCIIDTVENNFDNWHNILSVIAERYSIYYVKNKSIKHMIRRLNDTSFNKIVLSKNMSIQAFNNKMFIHLKYKK